MIQQGNQINPKTFDKRMKNYCINQNVFNSGYGTYKTCPYSQSIKFEFIGAYDPGPATSVCEVFVFNEHTLNVIDTISPKGYALLSSQKSYPAIIYPIGREFIGTNFESREGIYDDTLLLRTNYAFIIKKNCMLFPIKNDSEVIYTKLVTIIRDNNYNFLNFDNLLRIAVVAVFPPPNVELLNDEGDIILSSKDLLKFQMGIESAFQVCISGNHDTIIIPVLDEEFKIPYSDQAMIYNYCILKYGHKFKSIVVVVNPNASAGSSVFKYFSENILKPSEITQEIDTKYNTEQLKNKMLQESTK